MRHLLLPVLLLSLSVSWADGLTPSESALKQQLGRDTPDPVAFCGTRSTGNRGRACPHQIGAVGYSAGANLPMNQAANFDSGDPQAPDPVERQSCRPDFAAGLGMWHRRKPENPFKFPATAPPVYLVHAITDKPVEMEQSPRQS
jgi:hypothetical protein